MPETKSKQETIHRRHAFRSIGQLCCAVCGFGIFSVSVSSQVQKMTAANEQMSTVRMVAIGGLKNGMYEAGVDLAMAPGSHTYWKMPGEAGVPPVFTFNGSENVRRAEVKYPAPSRITEEGLEAFGYTTQVVFPVLVTPEDTAKPATLHADVTYAVCNRICLPGHAEASITMQPRGEGQSPDLLEAALTKVPRSTPAVDELHIARETAASQPSWTLTWTGKAPVSDIFSDAPAGFYFSTKKSGDATWTLTAEQSVTAPTSTKVPVTLVLAKGTTAVETTQTFDIAPGGK